MKGTLLCFLSGFAIAAAEVDSAPPNDLDRATVTIPYLELRKLWEAAQAKKEVTPPPSPPVASVIHSAELQLHFGELTSTVEAIFDIESLDAGWQSIRLLSGDASLDRNDAQDQSVVWQDGYALLTNKVGRSRVKLELATAGVKSLTTPRDLKLHVESATIKRLRIRGVPDGFEVRVNGHLPTSIANDEAMFALPGASGELTVNLSASAPAPPPARLSKWEGQSQVLVQSIEGRLQFVSRTRVHADGGSGLEAAFTLPANATVINATGEDLADSVNERTEEGTHSAGAMEDPGRA
jgi:hypothetical protein